MGREAGGERGIGEANSEGSEGEVEVEGSVGKRRWWGGEV